MSKNPHNKVRNVNTPGAVSNAVGAPYTSMRNQPQIPVNLVPTEQGSGVDSSESKRIGGSQTTSGRRSISDPKNMKRKVYGIPFMPATTKSQSKELVSVENSKQPNSQKRDQHQPRSKSGSAQHTSNSESTSSSSVLRHKNMKKKPSQQKVKSNGLSAPSNTRKGKPPKATSPDGDLSPVSPNVEKSSAEDMSHSHQTRTPPTPQQQLSRSGRKSMERPGSGEITRNRPGVSSPEGRSRVCTLNNAAQRQSSSSPSIPSTQDQGKVQSVMQNPSRQVSIAQPTQQESMSAPVYAPVVSENALRMLFAEFTRICNALTIKEMCRSFDTLPMADRRACEYGLTDRNAHLNRYSNIRCLDTTRVPLRFLCAELDVDYIHANFVNHSTLNNRFILTQGPLNRSVGDFWRMVWQEKAVYIFMLCRTIESRKTKSAQYLPETTQLPLILYANTEYELKVTILGKKMREDSQLVYIKVLLQHKGSSHTVMHVQWKGWPDCQAPEATSNVPFTLLSQSRNASGLTVVHCSAGVGRSGTLVAIEMALMEFARGRVPQISSLIRQLRSKRAHCVQTFEQFCYIYRAVLQFGINNGFIRASDFEPFAYEMFRRGVPDDKLLDIFGSVRIIILNKFSFERTYTAVSMNFSSMGATDAEPYSDDIGGQY